VLPGVVAEGGSAHEYCVELGPDRRRRSQRREIIQNVALCSPRGNDGDVLLFQKTPKARAEPAPTMRTVGRSIRLPLGDSP
jgi:hypothetical protein